jgi:peptidyl-prolyl cis-trans isomerase A (cyclophilin A)
MLNGFRKGHSAPTVNAKWHAAVIPDDPPAGQSNTRGTVTFATAGPNTRTTQVFLNFGDNSRLDRQGFVPFGRVVSGMDVVDNFYAGYGEGAPNGNGPEQGRLQSEGSAYTQSNFPKMDYIKSAKIE